MRHFAALACFLLAMSHGNAVSAAIEGNEALKRVETVQERFLESSNSGAASDQVLEFALQEGSGSAVSEVDEDVCDCGPKSHWKKAIVVAIAFLLILLATWHSRNKPDDIAWKETS
ncbi:MAG: hypothetical protein CL456_02210 [Acidimicrobiaceae bacterium]|nr:hypothetical protein [Acidimicrobiaceae bacterium]